MPRDDRPEDRGPAYAPVTSAELHGYYYEDLEIGMTAAYSRTVTEADIVNFSGVSGDINPVHLSDQFGRDGMFGERIAPGMLSAGFISAVIANKLPGPGAIYMGQSLKFMAPVRAGETVNTRLTVRELNDEKCRAILDTICMVNGAPVIEGEAMVKVPSRDG